MFSARSKSFRPADCVGTSDESLFSEKKGHPNFMHFLEDSNASLCKVANQPQNRRLGCLNSKNSQISLFVVFFVTQPMALTQLGSFR